MKANLEHYFPAYLEKVFPQWRVIKVLDIEDLTAGWESTIYALKFTCQQEGRKEEQELVLRIYAGENASAKASHEFNGMQLLHESGYPVPLVYHVQTHPSEIGDAFMLMERINGDVMWPLMEASPPQRRAELLTRFCSLFAHLHQLDWAPFVDSTSRIEDGGPFFFIDRWIEDARRSVIESGQEGFLPLVDWIAQNRDAMGMEAPSLIHNDFHPANVLLIPGGPAVVIDWTGWQVTDPRFDLAWTLLLARAYSGMEMYQAILSGYEDAADGRVENIMYFEVVACARRLFDIVISLSQGAEQRGMRPAAEESMRSQLGHLTVVYELLKDITQIRIPQVEKLLLQ